MRVHRLHLSVRQRWLWAVAGVALAVLVAGPAGLRSERVPLLRPKTWAPAAASEAPLDRAPIEPTQVLPPAAHRGPTATVAVDGRRLLLGGMPFTVRGVGYAPTPIGGDPEVPPYPDFFSSTYGALHDRDLSLLRALGANTVRLWGWAYDGDHSAFLDRAWNGGRHPLYVIASYWLDPSRDISDPGVRQAIRAEFAQMVALHKDHPAVLMWAIGNELNGPWMFGNRTELFTLIDELAQAAHAEEGASFHPVTTPLADVDLVATLAQRDALVPNLDLWSVQVYRGSSFGTLFEDYAAVSDKPLLITEYGIDAYDDRLGQEYEAVGPAYQATYATALWNEIASHTDVCAGGSIMAYSDEWWKGKYGPADAGHPDCPDPDPAAHSACGYASGAHPDGFANEEWWGIVRPVDNGPDPDWMQPRTVYYALQSLWTHTVYQPLLLRHGP